MFQGVDLTLLAGKVEGVDNLEIGKDSTLSFSPDARINTEQHSEIQLSSMLVLGGGVIEFTGTVSVTADQEMTITLSDSLVMRGGGVMRGNKLSITGWFTLIHLFLSVFIL